MSQETGIEQIRKEMDDDHFHLRYEWVSGLMQANIQNISRELTAEEHREVIKSFQSRLKTPESIYHKMDEKGLQPSLVDAREALYDLIGIRIIVMFLDDVYKVEQGLYSIPGLTLVCKKDYIERPKENGYRSLHLIFQTDLRHNGEMQREFFEVQIRTMAMDCWSALDHQMIYKQRISNIEDIKAELEQYSQEIAAMDYRMMEIRDAIAKGGNICLR